ncbi:hypothetical protein GCM10011506_13170 [Marivirga lumbricoides]|uniref:Uncharacterized protein n=1 Tax=Marivirga lumbricoides TaxID=1046115 RepID=A0ABQ1LX35_9BACT|nr:hypothetical protein GCM10011506_13170 [Marivirga lumbricoides]
MDKVELKKNFHTLIDSIENESLLQNFYDLIRSKADSKNGQTWGRLNRNEQEELLIAFEESENSQNLIDNETMKKKHSKWL